MKLDELLAKDTNGMSLSQMIDAVDGAMDDENVILAIRKRHEEDTGIPMEEDDLGKLFSVKMEMAFPEITTRLNGEQTK